MSLESGSQNQTSTMTKSEKIKKIKYEQKSNRRNEKIKKLFGIAAPTMNLRKKGEGVRVKNVGGIYSAGKCAVFAICVRTQIDFYITGCIVTPPNNKTRLKRFIFVYNGRYVHKQDGTRRKMNKYTQYYYKLAYLCTKTC